MKWAVYFREYEDLDYAGPSSAEQCVIVEAESREGAIQECLSKNGDVRIVEIMPIRSIGVDDF